MLDAQRLAIKAGYLHECICPRACPRCTGELQSPARVVFLLDCDSVRPGEGNALLQFLDDEAVWDPFDSQLVRAIYDDKDVFYKPMRCQLQSDAMACSIDVPDRNDGIEFDRCLEDWDVVLTL